MKLLTIILAFISTLGFSQVPENRISNTTDYIIEVINKVRLENGLSELPVDSSLVLASKHHTTYVSVYYPADKRAYSHSEVLRDSSHLIETIPNFRNRALKYGASIGPKRLTENLVVRKIEYITFESKEKAEIFNSTNTADDVNDIKKSWDASIKLYNSIESNSVDYKAAAEYIVYEWMLSPGHRHALLDPKGITIGAYQSVYVGSDGNNYVAGTYMIKSNK